MSDLSSLLAKFMRESWPHKIVIKIFDIKYYSTYTTKCHWMTIHSAILIEQLVRDTKNETKRGFEFL